MRYLASVLMIVALSSPLLAQQDDPKKNCDLIVRVRTSGEWRVENPIQIQVLTPVGVLATTTVIGEASTQFRVTRGRSYRLQVSGAGIESVTTPYFEVEPLEDEHTETVHVKPLSGSGAGQSAPAGPAIVSVSEMGVPKNASNEMQKGLENYARGDLSGASAHFQKAIADYPQYARAYDMMGAIAIRQPDRPKARDLFRKSIEVDGTYSPAYVDLARMDVQDRQYAESESLLAKAISFNPSLPDAMALLATTEFVNKEYDKALADVERTHALRNHEPFAEVHILAGKVHAMQHHADLAIAQFQLFLKEKPASPEADSVRKALASLQSGQQP